MARAPACEAPGCVHGRQLLCDFSSGGLAAFLIRDGFHTEQKAFTMPARGAVLTWNVLGRRLLHEEFRSGRLDAAPSKAEVLGELCERLNFDPDAAAQLHKQLYSEKLSDVAKDKKITGVFWPLASVITHEP
jgi:hypothetical protein